MAQMTESLARAILEGAGVTRHELEQLAHHFIATSHIYLSKPVRVGGVVFNPGVPWSTVIGCAERAYEAKPVDEKQAAIIRDMLARPKISDDKTKA